MADLNYRLSLTVMELTNDWKELVVPVECTSVETTANVEWEWATDRNGATRGVGSFTREPIVDRARVLFARGTQLCWVRAKTTTGQLWIKAY